MVTPSNNSYAPPKSTVADVATEIGEFEKAPRATRLGAAILDGVIFLVAWIPALVIVMSRLGPIMGAHGQSPTATAMISGALSAAGGWLLLAGLIQIALFVVTAVLVHRNGQTIAKKWLGIKVVRSDGSRASLGRIFWLRNVVNGLPGVLPYIGKIYSLVDACFIFGDAERCIHDYIADTIVVRA